MVLLTSDREGRGGVGCSRDSGGRGPEGVQVIAPSGTEELESDECHLLLPSDSLL